MVFGEAVTVQVLDTDRYGRTVGEVITSSGKSLNHELVAAGLAWWYRKYAPNDRTLERLEQLARAAGSGLWSRTDAVAPWEWRRGRRGERAVPAVGPGTLPDGGRECTFWLNTRSGVRHNPGCRYFRATSVGRCCGAGEGRACGGCGG
jgi:hypothetical protein